MKRMSVTSSTIKSIGYNPLKEILEVEFVKGTIYVYYNVPSEIYVELCEAESIGSYFMKNIAKKFKYEKVS